MSSLSLAEGTLFNGRYCVARCIAMGGMGAVYEVIHKETERRRALKVMLPHLVQSDDMRSRFRQEARIAARIDSEFIVDVFDAGIDEATGMPFLVMELLQGEDLGETLKRAGRLSAEGVVTYLYQAALALEETHRAHIVHRDLKPVNLFLEQRPGRTPRIKVLDFGIAKIVAEGATHANATQSLGTPLYMAPEQFQPGASVTAATDIYALGMVAYTLLVGTAYWKQDFKGNDNLYKLIVSVLQGLPEKATTRALRSGVLLPVTFDSWFTKVTALSPAERFPSAVEAILALGAALGIERPEQEDGRHMSENKLAPMLPGRPSQPSLPAAAGWESAHGDISGVASTGARSSINSVLRRRSSRSLAVALIVTCVAIGGSGLFLKLRASSRAAINIIASAKLDRAASAAAAIVASAPAPAIDVEAAAEKASDLPSSGPLASALSMSRPSQPPEASLARSVTSAGPAPSSSGTLSTPAKARAGGSALQRTDAPQKPSAQKSIYVRD